MPHSDYAPTSIPDHPNIPAFLQGTAQKLQDRTLQHLPVLPSSIETVNPVAQQLEALISNAIQHIDRLRVHHSNPMIPMAPSDNYVLQLQALQRDLIDCSSLVSQSLQLISSETNDATTRYAELQGIFIGIDQMPARCSLNAPFLEY